MKDFLSRSPCIRQRPDGTHIFRHDLRDSLDRLCCNLCGEFVWWSPGSWRFHYNHCPGLKERKARDKQRRRNPMNIDLSIKKDPKRSACAVMVCDVAERAQAEITRRLHETDDVGDVDALVLLVASTDVRVKYLKATRCHSGNRITLAAACVYVASKIHGIWFSQDALHRVSGVTATGIRNNVRNIESALGLDVLRPRFSMPKHY
jgi:hypothetical protein